ncbi:hypothetical protein [Myroides guanonis]|uniref:Uncharacterized protein n=1 Tax=Myroides guanonis TaxID=1150112 RepID=A0A1I3PCE1_9FLAO|nr:hypothetical protein [Myroides guanonis]SFJ19071.1 hypothetical protein SAMN04487893_10462 [Myroides guanonis]
MKATQTFLESHVWERKHIECPYELLERLFCFISLEELKSDLRGKAIYCYRRKIFNKRNLPDIFWNYVIIKSAIRAAYLLNLMDKKYRKDLLIENDNNQKNAFTSALTLKESQNPYLVLKRVFKQTNLDDLEIVLLELIDFSLRTDGDEPSWDLLTPYIQINQILDTCWLINERSIESVSN